MAAAIKKFFEKRKLDVQFKKAGGGHKLTDDTRTNVPVGSPTTSNVRRAGAGITEEQQRAMAAAEARMARLNSGSTGAGRPSGMTQVKQEILAEKKVMEKALADAARYSAPSRQVEQEAAPVVSGVFFHCPMIGEVLLPRADMERVIEEFLLSQLCEEPEMTSALIIHTLNRNTEQVAQCIETIGKYLDNIIDHPGEDKYRRIRCANKVLNERVLALRGSLEFMQAAGFVQKSLPDGGEVEDYLVFDMDRANDIDRLRRLQEFLTTAEPIRPVLARCTKVFRVSDVAARAAENIQVPDEFYAVSAEELKQEAKIRAEAIEQMGMLRTKQMRERDRARELRRYRYCLIRVRFPDGTIAQATFGAAEKMSAVKDWLTKDILALDWMPYMLTVTGGQRVDVEEKSSLAELDLAPACIINFVYDKSVADDIAISMGEFGKDGYVCADLLVDAASL